MSEMTNMYVRYKNVVIIVTIISLLCCIILPRANGYELVFLIPMFFLVFFFFSNKLHKYSSRNIGIFILNVLAFIKYSFSPLTMAVTGDLSSQSYYGATISSTSNRMAIFIILVEMAIVFLTIFLFSDKFYKNSLGTQFAKKKIMKIPITPFLLFVVVLLITVFLSNIDVAIPKKLLLINGEFEEDDFSGDGLSVIISLSKLVLSGLLINHLIVKYKKSSKLLYVILSYIVVLIFCLLNTGISRRSIILPLVFFALITYHVFKRKGKILLIGSLVLLLSSFMTITVYKSSWLYSGNENYFTIATTSLGGIQEYTSNIRPVAIGIEMLNNYSDQISPDTFVNDFLGSIPFVGRNIVQTDRLNSYYNNYIFNGANTSQIVPMSIVGLAYFGIVFTWLPVFVCILLLMFFERRVNRLQETNYLEQYLMLYLFFVFAASLNSNTQMVIARIMCSFLPAYLIIKINGVLCKKTLKE